MPLAIHSVKYFTAASCDLAMNIIHHYVTHEDAHGVMKTARTCIYFITI